MVRSKVKRLEALLDASNIAHDGGGGAPGSPQRQAGAAGRQRDVDAKAQAAVADMGREKSRRTAAMVEELQEAQETATAAKRRGEALKVGCSVRRIRDGAGWALKASTH
jgi:hypothetical protein